MIRVRDFVRQRPDAVFVRAYEYGSFEEIHANDGFYRGGREIVEELFVADRSSGERIFLHINNVCMKPEDMEDMPEDPPYHGGVSTNPQFVAGMVDAMLGFDVSPEGMYVGGGGRARAETPAFRLTGYLDMIEEPARVGKKESRAELGVSLVDCTRSRFEDYASEELVWVDVPDGVIHQRIPFVAPVRTPGTKFINVPTLKTHNLGIATLCCKGFQGVIATGYRHFCSHLRSLANGGRMAWEHLAPGFEDRVKASYRRHVEMGLPLWDTRSDVWELGNFESWAQRTVDAVSTLLPFEEHIMLNVVEGIIGRNGTAFRHGWDVPVGLVVAGINPVHVDAVAAFLMGHDPKYLPHIVLAEERGLGRSRMEEIEVYVLPERRRVDAEALSRWMVPLFVYLHGDTSKEVYFTEAYFDRHGVVYARR